MLTAEALLEQLKESNQRTLFVVCLGFEDRCKGLPRLIGNAKLDGRRNRTLCITLPDENVLPLLVLKRAELRAAIQEFTPAEFKNATEGMEIIRAAAQRATQTDGGQDNIVVDVSTMPRNLIFDLLQLIADNRPDFFQVFLTYTHPKEYLSGQLEVLSPLMKPLYADSRLQAREKVLLAMFPGFNPGEAAVALSSVLARCQPLGEIRVKWVFVHPGSKYANYEKAIGQHIVFREHLRDLNHATWICNMHDFRQIGWLIGSFSDELLTEEVMILAGLGPRVISAPLLIAARVLREAGKPVNILVPHQIFYNSLRSTGESPHCSAWDLSQEYARIRQKVGRTGA